MVIENKHTSPIPSKRQKNIPASSLLNGISGSGQVVLNQNSTINNSTIQYPTIVDAPRAVNTTGTATISVLASDTLSGIVIYQSSTPATTVQLPAANGIYPITDGSLNSASYPITVLPPAGLTILGQTAFTIDFNGQSSTFASDGTQIIVT